MHMLPPIAVAAVLSLASAAAAADLTVTVKGDDGAPLADTVVLVHPASGSGPAAALRFSWPIVMTQQNIAFNPYVLIVPLGSTVGFPNKDKVRHHVYSFSAAKKFELKLYGQQEERTVTFDKPGLVALGCNIHDSMIGYIYVSDTPFAAKTNEAGQAAIRGLPGGSGTLSVWHPDSKSGKAADRPVSLAAGAVQVTLDLKPVSLRRKKPMAM